MSRRMITLLRHEQNILRKEDGAIEFRRLKSDLNAKLSYSVRWSDITWVDHLKRGGGRKKSFQLCTNHTGLVILYFRTIQCHSGETTADPSLLDSVLILEDFFAFIYDIGSCVNMHSIIASGSIAGGTIHGRDRQTVFFTAVDPMDENWVGQEGELDMSQL